MAKRRTKKRTHKKISPDEASKIPKSMVIHLGKSLQNHSLSQLVGDFRNLMQPHTAINLKERKSNKLKDFIVMCGPLGVHNLFIFNQSAKTGQLSLRIGKMPKGPVLQFKINSYSLCKDVRKILKHPKSVNKDSLEFVQPPLLVMNGFGSKFNEIENHEKLLITMFQNMFPPIQPQSTKVSDIKRVLLISKNKSTGEIEIRHYAINTKLVEENRNVKKLINANHNLKKNLPNMSKNQDISDLILDPYAIGGMTSDSEVEDDAIVEIKNQEAIKKEEEKKEQINGGVKKRAIKLIELGPRLNLSLNKIEENVSGSSKVLYHSNINKSESEVNELNKKHELKQKLKQERREKQQAVVKAKLEKKKKKKGKSTEGDEEDGEAEESDDNEIEINPEDYENDSDLYSDVEV